MPDSDVPDKLLRLVDSIGNPIGWRYTTATDEIEDYDASGKLLTITDRSGLTQTLAYSDGTGGPNGGFVLDAVGIPTPTALPASLLTRITDAYARSLTLGYDAQSRIVKMTDPAGGIYKYTYDANNNLSSVTYPDQTSKTYLYEDPAFTHALTGITDENGNRYATYAYDAQGRAISSEHATGVEKVTLTYNTDGTTSITDALGTVRTQTFQTVLGVVKNGGVNQPGGSGCGAASSNMTYDANGNVSSSTDFNGNQTCHAYDLARNLETKRVEGLPSTAVCSTALDTPPAPTAANPVRTITTRWHSTYRLPSQIAEPLRLTTYAYDPSGNLLAKTVQATSDATGAQGLTATASGTPRTFTYTYNTAGQVLTIDGPRTDVADITQYAYDTQGNLTTVTNTLSQATTLGNYDAHGRVGTLTDPNGAVTSLTYTPRGWLNTRSAAGETTTYDYDGVGQVTKVTLPDGSYISYTYDAAHRLTDITDRDGNKISYTLDNMGNRTREDIRDTVNNLVQTKSRTFDALNRLWKDIGAVNQTTVYEYDANGNLTKVTDPLNHTTTNQYDALNRLSQTTNPDAGLIRYDYNGLDQLTQLTDPRNLVTQYTRDGLNNLTQTVSPDTGTSTATFDAAGNALTRTDAKGQVANYSYDALNRLTGISYTGAPAQTVTYTYDQGANGIGHLTGIIDATGTASYSYDQHGRLTSEVRQSYGASYTTAYSYDAQGRLNSITYPSGRTVNYTLDNQGRINQITTTYSGQSKTLASDITYQPFGGVQSFTFGDGSTEPVQTYTRQFDQDGRIASYTLNGQARSIGYDDASRIAFVSGPASIANYSYDPMNRLTGYTQGATSQSFGYDADGNRLSQTVGTTTTAYTYPPTSNRLTSIQTGAAAPQALTQDANGATTSDPTHQYGYDIRGRLIQTTTAQGNISYTVNALGLRTRKQAPYAGTDTVYHYDAQGHLIGESAAGSTQFTREYIYLGDQPVAVMQ